MWWNMHDTCDGGEVGKTIHWRKNRCSQFVAQWMNIRQHVIWQCATAPQFIGKKLPHVNFRIMYSFACYRLDGVGAHYTKLFTMFSQLTETFKQMSATLVNKQTHKGSNGGQSAGVSTTRDSYE